MNSRRIAAGTQLRGVLWRELKEWPVVLGSGGIVCQSPSPRLFCPSFYEYHPSIQAEEALESFWCCVLPDPFGRRSVDSALHGGAHG